MEPLHGIQNSPGALPPFENIFVNLGNAAHWDPLKIPQNDAIIAKWRRQKIIGMLFFYFVLSPFRGGSYTAEPIFCRISTRMFGKNWNRPRVGTSDGTRRRCLMKKPTHTNLVTLPLLTDILYTVHIHTCTCILLFRYEVGKLWSAICMFRDIIQTEIQPHQYPLHTYNWKVLLYKSNLV